MAYAALVSLAQKLDQIHRDPHHILHYRNEDQYFKTLYQSVVELQDILEKIPEKSQQQITICANEAEDMIDCYVSHRLPAKGGCCGLTSCLMEILLFAASAMFPHYRIGDKDVQISCKDSTNLHQKLQKVTADIISLAEEAKKVEGSGDEIEHVEVSGSLSIAEEAKKVEGSGEEIEHVQVSGSLSIAEEANKVEGSGDEIEHAQVFGSLPSPNSSMTRKQFKKYSRNRSQLRGEDAAVGFDEDLKEIKGRLCEGPSQRQIIPIIAMGGAGKTTLARILYHDPLIVKRFDVRAWITVSQKYDLREILLWLLEDIKGSSRQDYARIDNEGLGVEVYKSLKARRYLIVIDDIWSETFWDEVHNLLPDDHNRSRILLTTRLSHVATYADCTTAVHYVQLLDMDYSWSLLEEKVFGQATCPLDLEVVGKNIASNCGGLPLAIVVMAGILLDIDRNHNSWKSIENSGAISNGDHQILEILSLSYTHLPHHLKACFLYAGSFPEDYDIPVTRLIMLWIAEGFLKPSRSKSLEELAYGYIEDLAKKNLIFVSRRRSNGRIRSFRIHDSMRDVCVKTAQREKFLYLTDNYHDFIGEGIISPRRLAIYSDKDIINSLEDLYSPSNRSVLYFRFRADFWVPVETFKLIRVLDALAVVFHDFPSQICQLFFLRYLAFSHDKIEKLQLPSTMTKLTELQTLFISPYFKHYLIDEFILVLPRDIWKMPQLRHLIFWQKTILPIPSERRTLVLENLQTLSEIVNLRFTRQVLEMIPNIRKLGIYYSTERAYQQWPNYCLDNLEHLLQLQTLSLTVEPCLSFQIREKIKLPESLKKLTLDCSMIPWVDLGRIAGSLPNLEVLKLKEYACDGNTWETKQGEFPKLKMLEINSTWPDTWITEDCSHFPNLERLCMFNCRRKIDLPLPECIGEIETLQSIEVDEYSIFLLRWAKAVQEEQDGIGNEIQVLIPAYREDRKSRFSSFWRNVS